MTKKEEEPERDMLSEEADNKFQHPVITGELREDAIANDFILGTRRRKRPSTLNTDLQSPDLGGGTV